MDAVVGVVNGWSAQVRAEAGDTSTSYPDLAELLPAGSHRDLADMTDEQLVGIAERLFAVFSGQTVAAKLGALNEAIRQIGPTPAVSATGPRWQITQQHQALEAALLLSLVEHAREDRHLVRLGTCDADRCCDVYVDATQAETRRYCSGSCQNRAKVAQHRRRQRAASRRGR